MRVPRPSVPRTVALVAVAAAATLGLVSPAAAAPTPSTATSNAAAIRPVLHGIDLEAATIPDLQRAMDAGMTAVELTSVYLRRIGALNHDLDAVLERQPRRPRRRRGQRPGAAQARRPRPARGHPGAAQGQHRHRATSATTAGSRALLGSRAGPGRNLVRRLRAAGAVILGKANLTEWANFRGDRLHQRVERRGRPDQQPLRPGPQPVRFVQRLGRGRGRRAGPGGDRHRDRRLDRLPVRRERRGRAQADARPRQPGRHRADLAPSRTPPGRWPATSSTRRSR